MNDLEISKALALAIGWTENRRDENGCLDPDVAIFGHGGYCQHYGEPDEVKCWDGDDWVTFDYKDWNVVGPIAAKYSAFPASISTGNFRKAKAQGYTDVAMWEVLMYDYKTGKESIGSWVRTTADTPQKAIAMAVINGVKK